MLSLVTTSAVVIPWQRPKVVNGQVPLVSKIGGDEPSSEKLILLMRAVGGDGYRCDGGAERDQEDALFVAAGIDLVHQTFSDPNHPPLVVVELFSILFVMDMLMKWWFL